MDIERQLARFRSIATRGQSVEELYQCSQCGHKLEGFEYLKSELEKVMATFRKDAVSVESLKDPINHAVAVGAHNAMQSFLDILELQRSQKDRALESIRQLEKQREAEEKADAV